jgi:hypothetical protein
MPGCEGTSLPAGLAQRVARGERAGVCPLLLMLA